MAPAEATQHAEEGWRSHQAVPPTGDGERCLETFLVVPPGLGAIDSRWAEARMLLSILPCTGWPPQR